MVILLEIKEQNETKRSSPLEKATKIVYLFLESKVLQEAYEVFAGKVSQAFNGEELNKQDLEDITYEVYQVFNRLREPDLGRNQIITRALEPHRQALIKSVGLFQENNLVDIYRSYQNFQNLIRQRQTQDDDTQDFLGQKQDKINIQSQNLNETNKQSQNGMSDINLYLNQLEQQYQDPAKKSKYVLLDSLVQQTISNITYQIKNLKIDNNKHLQNTQNGLNGHVQNENSTQKAQQQGFSENIQELFGQLGNKNDQQNFNLNQSYIYNQIKSQNKVQNKEFEQQSSSDSVSESDTEAKHQIKINLTSLKHMLSPIHFGDQFESLQAVCGILLSTNSKDDLANELFNLFDNFEIIQKITENRKELVYTLKYRIDQARKIEHKLLDSDPQPEYLRSVNVMSKTQYDLKKQELKKQKQQRKKQQQKGNSHQSEAVTQQQEVEEYVESLNLFGVQKLLTLEENKSNQITFGDGTTYYIGEGQNDTKVLPKGTKRKVFKGWEEISVPAPDTKPNYTEGDLIPTSTFESWAQLAFKNIKRLNIIQSTIYPTAFHTNQNMLVCAPTGAGKTNIAMICILREISQNMRNNVIQKNEFKIIYVAPMKALAGEVTSAFSTRLQPLGLTVREFTGDMQLTRKELAETQVIVTTPEKWDAVTRKGTDGGIASQVKLIIVDEVHLLHEERGAVIESLIARTQRQVESTQSLIRIVGLSATLPNYEDVGEFLGIGQNNKQQGIFFFDQTYRPIPLHMRFAGIQQANFTKRNQLMNQVCFDQIINSLRKDQQAMIFVHSRKETVKTALTMIDIAAQDPKHVALFDNKQHPQFGIEQSMVKKSRNKDLYNLFNSGFGIHHAGMLRSDRNLSERLFSLGLIKVLVCTSTLAWGVNLPAHTVVIKGTQIYDSTKGQFSDVSVLDVQQIFGRAGRPQFDTSGEGIIITTHDKLAHYVGLITNSTPIESQFTQSLIDNLNAEVVLGTVTNVREASIWLSYTYLYVRMKKNPLAYGIEWDEIFNDPLLSNHRQKLISEAAKELENCRMARFDSKSGQLYVTELGRVASHYYIRHETITTFTNMMKQNMTEESILHMLSCAFEFEQIVIREDELIELEQCTRKAETCPFEVRFGVENREGKVNILIQAYISQAKLNGFSLIADMMYVAQNAPRICRALYEISLRKGWSILTSQLLDICKSLEKRIWAFQHPLRQFEVLDSLVLDKLEQREIYMERIEDMEAQELGAFLRQPQAGRLIKKCYEQYPKLELDVHIQPITRTILRVILAIKPVFQWHSSIHGQQLKWLVLVEDTENDHIYHQEIWISTQKMCSEPLPQRLGFSIPIFEPLPSHYVIRVVSDSWLGAEAFTPVSFNNLHLPDQAGAHTELLDLTPLPISSLQNKQVESLYKFTHFNPIQTQIFHTIFHTDSNILLGAPTGSGKTISAELAIFRVFKEQPGKKIIYIAPLKALVRERILDWQNGLCKVLNKSMVELTGDYTPDLRALTAADIIICTPEKWDGISRNWQTRSYVRQVALLVIDEIHLLGADRGPILEVIISRMRYISSMIGRNVRFVGLSTALANAQDIAVWLGVNQDGLFNFRPSVRPVPLEAHIQGFSERNYCPRMATMNKPTYAAIQSYSPTKPVLVFVSSRRQTRLTALDLINLAAQDLRPRQFLRMEQDELQGVLDKVRDSQLKHSLQFGIGLHHAGLKDQDRQIVEKLFVDIKIQILIATSTLAWGVNTPTHLVVIKGTEYYDAPSKRYVDMPITDVLQMMGRAGRPQFDKSGVAVIMVHDPKKAFYKKFLYEPFPVESSLQNQLADHLNAEIVSGTITSMQDAVHYITWTYFYRRLVQNPTYYDLSGTEFEEVQQFLSLLIQERLKDLEQAGCIKIIQDDISDVKNDQLEATPMGRIASYYYLRHETIAQYEYKLTNDLSFIQILEILSQSKEYDDLPVRHNEDKLNFQMAQKQRFKVDHQSPEDPHFKANILLQAHMSRGQMPISDYITDTKGVLDNSLRLLQSIIDACAEKGWLQPTLSTINLIQCLMQGQWVDQSPLLQLPHLGNEQIQQIESDKDIDTLPKILMLLKDNSNLVRKKLHQVLDSDLQVQNILDVMKRLPILNVNCEKPNLTQSKNQLKQSMHGTEILNYAVEDKNQENGFFIKIHVHRPNQFAQKPQAKPANQRQSQTPRVIAPRFPKIKEEGWFLIVGNIQNRELYALKRTSVSNKFTVKLTLPDQVLRQGIPQLDVFAMSDSYVGLDQQIAIQIENTINQNRNNLLEHGYSFRTDSAEIDSNRQSSMSTNMEQAKSGYVKQFLENNTAEAESRDIFQENAQVQNQSNLNFSSIQKQQAIESRNQLDLNKDFSSTQRDINEILSLQQIQSTNKESNNEAKPKRQTRRKE